jgi:hypothetical protein
MTFAAGGALAEALSQTKPARREPAVDIAQLAADGLTLPEIARAMDLPRQRILKLAVQFKVRMRSAAKGRRA